MIARAIAGPSLRTACGTSGGLNQSSDLSLGVYGVMVTYKVPASAT